MVRCGLELKKKRKLKKRSSRNYDIAWSVGIIKEKEIELEFGQEEKNKKSWLSNEYRILAFT